MKTKSNQVLNTESIPIKAYSCASPNKCVYFLLSLPLTYHCDYFSFDVTATNSFFLKLGTHSFLELLEKILKNL